jgi:uncharacterized hydrophobic protein (TIGR00271 family)
VIHLRLVVPGKIGEDTVDLLCQDPRVVNVVVMTGASRQPSGDVLMCDVAREAVSDVIAGLRRKGLPDEASIAMQDVDAMTSPAADRAEAAAPGAPDDGIVWDMVLGQARADSRSSWSFYAFLCLATTIAAVAVITDSAILVVGAMVVGPEFGPVAATAVGLVLGRTRLVTAAVRLLITGFVVAIAVTTALALIARLAGWITPADLADPRPLTGFIWAPDRWSVVVALLAGMAGVLSLTAGRSNALVGVFISVTTVPAAGNLALAFALGVPGEIGGASAQLGINLAGMTIAGCLVLGIQRMLSSGLHELHSHPGPRPPAASEPRFPDDVP